MQEEQIQNVPKNGCTEIKNNFSSWFWFSRVTLTALMPLSPDDGDRRGDIATLMIYK